MNKYKRARLEAFLTQRQAALIFGVIRQSVSNWERGFCEPQRDDILAVYRTHSKRSIKGDKYE